VSDHIGAFADYMRARNRPSIVSKCGAPASFLAEAGLGDHEALALCFSSRRLDFAVYRKKERRVPHYTAKMQGISEILQFPVIVERRRPLPIESQPF
jgi:hypothetical protein